MVAFSSTDCRYYGPKRACGVAIDVSGVATAFAAPRTPFATPQTPFATPQTPCATPQMAGGQPQKISEKKICRAEGPANFFRVRHYRTGATVEQVRRTNERTNDERTNNLEKYSIRKVF